jgi:hypothetical protein
MFSLFIFYIELRLSKAEIDRQLPEIAEQLAKLVRHCGKSFSHSAKLVRHSWKLISHSAKLVRHSRKLISRRRNSSATHGMRGATLETRSPPAKSYNLLTMIVAV